MWYPGAVIAAAASMPDECILRGRALEVRGARPAGAGPAGEGGRGCRYQPKLNQTKLRRAEHR